MISVWSILEIKMLHLTYHFRDLQYMYFYLWPLRTDQILISNCPNAGYCFHPWHLAVLTGEWMGGQLGRGKYLVWPVSQNLLDVTNDVDTWQGYRCAMSYCDLNLTFDLDCQNVFYRNISNIFLSLQWYIDCCNWLLPPPRRYHFYNGGHGGTVVTHLRPTSEIRVRILAWPQLGKWLALGQQFTVQKLDQL